MARFTRYFLGALIAFAVAAQSPIPGPVVVSNTKTAGGAITLRELTANGQDTVGFKAPDSLAATILWQLPDADGSASECLTTDGSAVLSWAACSATSYWTRTGTNLTTTTAGDTVTIDSHLLFSAPSTSDIGDSTNYGQTIYMENADFAPTGIIGNYTQVRKLEVVDAGGGATFWDIQASGTGGGAGSYFYVRDNAGTAHMRLVPVESGGTTINQAQFNLSLVPGNNATLADDTFDVGSASRRWHDAHFAGTINTEDLVVNGTCTGCGSSGLPVVDTSSVVKGSVDATAQLRIEVDGVTTATTRVWTVQDADLTVAGIDLAQTWTATQTFQHIQFPTPSDYDIGTSTNYFQTAYGENMDLAPSGVTGNYANIRKLNIVDANGGTNFWDFQVNQQGAVSSNFQVRDNAGTTVFRLVQTESSSTVTQAQFLFSIVPGSNSTLADNTYDLGSSIRQWRSAYLATSLLMGGSSVIDSSRNVILNPTGTGSGVSSANLSLLSRTAGGVDKSGAIRQDSDGNIVIIADGGAFNAVLADGTFSALSGIQVNGSVFTDSSRNTTVNNLTVNGVCTGCTGSSQWTRTGTELRTATAGDDVAIRTSGGTQTVKLRASDGAILAGSIQTGNSPTWTQRIDGSGNFYAATITISGSWSIGSGGTAILGSVFASDYRQGATTRIDSSGNGNFANMTISGTCSGCGGYWTSSGGYITPATAGTPVSVRTSGGSHVITMTPSTGEVAASTLTIAANTAVDSSRNGRFATLYTGSGTGTLRIDGSGNFTANSIVFPGGIFQITSSGVGILSALASSGPLQGSNVNITATIAGTPSTGATLYVSGTQLRVRFSTGVDKEVSLI